MTERIKAILTEIEQQKKIKILYACETGSRAWGFPSPDSDYDVRFVYIHKRDWYLSLRQRKDSIEHMDGDMDVTGWDIKKCLSLLKKSNGPLIERFQSPIVYAGERQFAESFKQLIESYYSPTAVFYHHHSMAVKFWESLKDEQELKLKSFFYLVRSLLSCNWIIEDGSVLPMDIFGLMRKIDREARNRLEGLIKLKASVDEKFYYSKDAWMNNWIEQMWSRLELSKNNLGISKADITDLDNFFLKIINENADN